MAVVVIVVVVVAAGGAARALLEAEGNSTSALPRQDAWRPESPGG